MSRIDIRSERDDRHYSRGAVHTVENTGSGYKGLSFLLLQLFRLVLTVQAQLCGARGRRCFYGLAIEFALGDLLQRSF